MPELPEVETTRRGIEPHVLGQTVQATLVRQAQMRWPVPSDLGDRLQDQRIESVGRRGKYLLFETRVGCLIVHLGMSGSLRIVAADAPVKKHDHVDLVFSAETILRYHDPRRFGCLLWTAGPAHKHPLLAELGPEPLGADFNGEYLHRMAQGRTSAVKSFLMDSHIVVGVGNIYANEALFRAGIDPRRAAGRVSLERYLKLAACVRDVLQAAIIQGGTTLRDFVNASGNPGYFQQTLTVYGREGEPCRICGKPLRCVRLGQRATYFCDACQH